jgi:uncharacterized protein (TIGR02611 family)
MQWIKRHWHNAPHPLRKLLVFVVGWTVIIAGVAMLALPGPGWATIFFGFAILAHEYTSARQVRDLFVAKLKAILKWLKKTFNISFR